MRGKQLASIGLIALILLSSIGTMIGPMSGTAIAQDDAASQNTTDDSCEWSDILYGSCDPFGHTDESTPIADKYDAFSEAKAYEADASTTLTILENGLRDTENQGWLEAEQAFFESYLNGNAKASARQAGIDAMRNHYAVRQENIIETHNNFLTSLWTVYNESKSFTFPSTGKLDQRSNYPAIDVQMDISSNIFIKTDFHGLTQQDRQLLDGGVKSVNSLNTHYRRYNWNSDQGGYWGYSGQEVTEPFNLFHGQKSISEVSSSVLDVRAELIPDNYPDDAQQTAVLTYPDRWKGLWANYNASFYDEKQDFGTFANKSYDALEAGKIDPQEVLSRLNQMEMFALELRNDVSNMTFNDGVIALSAMGLAAPGNATAYMNVTYQTEFGGQKYRTAGLLMSHSDPVSGSWEIGKTYNTTHIDGSQILVKLNGNQTMLKGDLTINEVYGQDGAVIDDPEIDSPDVSYKSTNLTDLRQDIRNMSAIVAEWENRTAPDAGGGRGGGGGFSWPSIGIPNPFAALGAFGQWIVLAGIVLLILALLSVL